MTPSDLWSLGAYDAVWAAVDHDDLEVLFTHVTVEELAAIPDYERRCRLLIFLIDLGRLVARILGLLIGADDGVSNPRYQLGKLRDTAADPA